VKVILAALGAGVALIVVLRVAKAKIANPVVKFGLVGVTVVLGVWLAVTLAGLDLGESGSREVPVMLFGLGAIGLVNEPRGVVYDIVNRQRLRQFKEAEERDEAEKLAADVAVAGAPA
jgi:hypothetical protein